MNYTTSFAYWLHFYVPSSLDWIDYKMPIPHYLLHSSRGGAFVAWLIDGYPGTIRGQNFLNDVIARVILTLRAERLPYRPYVKERKDSAHIHEGSPIKLCDLARGLVSLPSGWAGYNPNTKANGGHDMVFWAIKWKIEQIIGEIGEGTPVPYGLLESWAFANFVDETKDKSTLRAKCRSVWRWYDQRGWSLPGGRFFKMSRSEHIKQVHQKRREDSKRKVLNLISGLYADNYKAKSGKWNISKIAKDLGMGRDTVRKILIDLNDR